MVTLYADGKPIPWADAAKVVPECIARNQRIELRTEAGVQVGVITPTPAPAPAPADPLIPWEPTVTRDEIEKRLAEPGLSFDEVKKRLGWG